MSILNKGLLLILCILFPFLLFGQHAKDDHQLQGSRFVITPDFFPLKSYFFRQSSSDNIAFDTKVNSRIYIGTKIERYSPVKNFDYGFNLAFIHRNFSIYTPDEFKFNESSVSVTPFVSFKTATKIEDTKHWIFNIGIINNYTFQNTISYSTGERILDFEDAPIRKYRLFGYFELGIKKDNFYSSRWNYSKKSGQSLLSVAFSLPLFNQSYLFQYKDRDDFNTPFELFQNNRTTPLAFSLNYTQSFDLRKNANEAAYRDELALLSSTKSWRFAPPLLHFLYPTTKSFGTPYLKMIFHPKLDSIFIDNPVEGQIFQRTASASYELGYNYHILNNVSNQIGTLEKPNGLIYDLFFGMGLSHRVYLLQNDDFARASLFALEGKAGIRAGIKGVYLSLGYKRALQLRSNLNIKNKQSKINNFSNLNDNIFFLGIGFKNSVYIHLNYRTIDNLKTEKRRPFLDNLEYTIGIGI